MTHDTSTERFLLHTWGVPDADVHTLDPADPLARTRLLRTAYVATDGERCVQCGTCSYNCPLGLDVRAHARAGLPLRDRRCFTCGECVRRCPRDALIFVIAREVR